MTTSRYSLTLRVRHPLMSSAEIAAKIGIMPEIAQDVGEERKNPKGVPLPGVYKETRCSFSIGKGDFSAIEQELHTFTAKLLTIYTELKYITDTGGRIEYFIGCFIEGNSGMSLDEQLMRDLSQLKICLDFDLYGADDGQ